MLGSRGRLMAAYVWGFRVARFFNLAAGVCVAASALAASGAPAQAREWRHYHRVAHAYFAHHRGYAVARRPAPVEADAAFSAIVVDANSGRELYGVNENGLRHPASITKVMTLYLLFEQLDKGALTLQSPNSDFRARGCAGALETGHFRGRQSLRRRSDQGDRDPLGQ